MRTPTSHPRDPGTVTARAGSSPAPVERRWSAATVLAAALAMLGAVGLLDHVTEIELHPLYVAPVALVAWKLGLRAGSAMSALALATWAGSNFLAGMTATPWVWVLNSIAHLADYAVVVALVSFLQRSKAAECRLARTDPLTGLLNVRAFYEIASVELNRQRRYPRPMTLAFVDLDNFKEVNDRHGHKIGDRALVAVANAMRTATRTADILSRLGGDEFALLLPETDLEGARRLLQRLSAGVAQAMTASSWPVSCSIGAVTFETPPDNVDAIVTAADHLMYGVKVSGKSAVRIEPFPAHESPTPRSDSLASGGPPG